VEDLKRMRSNGILNEIRDKLRSFLNLFKQENTDKKLDKMGKYYQDLSKTPPKINKKIK
jgi:hypothetical protein